MNPQGLGGDAIKTNKWFNVFFLAGIGNSVAAPPGWDSKLSQGVAVNTITTDNDDYHLLSYYPQHFVELSHCGNLVLKYYERGGDDIFLISKRKLFWKQQNAIDQIIPESWKTQVRWNLIQQAHWTSSINSKTQWQCARVHSMLFFWILFLVVVIVVVVVVFIFLISFISVASVVFIVFVVFVFFFVVVTAVFVSGWRDCCVEEIDGNLRSPK